MTSHTVAEGDSNLSELLDRVMDGEGLVITRDGEPVAELKPVPRGAASLTAVQSPVEAEDEFLRMLHDIPQHIKDAAVAAVRAMRDEDEE
ncbi:MAG TPA: type II toxin-antitoxin system prevent-host-death family antitoxin [Stellaceae bacterium]|jgi:prevent-host-death family protein|nr:type II toxin-antitoxin system prevent-host-death family antitoxin [Stellaceae bacterium]